MPRLLAMTRPVLTMCLGIALILGWANVADSLVRWLPRLSYYIRASSVRTVCEQVRPGMAKSTVLRLIARAAEPSGEATTERQLGFSAGRFTCTVEFEGNADVVKAARLQVKPIFQPSTSWGDGEPGSADRRVCGPRLFIAHHPHRGVF
jgi:hypothetical protein